MKAGLAIALCFYWILFILALSPVLDGNPLYDAGYYTTADTGNFTGIDPNTDIGDVTLFTAIGAVIGAIGNFFILAFLGIGLPFDLPTWLQLMFTGWQVFISAVTAMTLISFIYEG